MLRFGSRMAKTSRELPESRRELHRAVSWGSAVLLAVAASLQITVAMGPMAGELGNFMPLVWAVAALMGLVQCIFIAELAVRFPRRSGGTATYAHEAFGSRAPWLAALSSWGYWFAWTPGVAVNLVLAAEYLRSTVAPQLNTVTLSLLIGVLLYAMNALGLRVNVKVTGILISVALVPLLIILVAPVIWPVLFHPEELWPLQLPLSHASHASAGVLVALLVKWLFVASWAAYGAEMASTIFAEFRTAGNAVVRVMATAGVTCLFAFTAIPLIATALVGSDGLDDDPRVVFLAPAQAVFGSVGATIVGLMLACALLAGAQAFVIASSRTLYQMSLDGYVPRLFQHLNRFGVPVRSVICDAAVIGLLVGLFGTNVVSVVAAANTGYLVVFVLMPLAFVVIRWRERDHGLVLPRWLTPVALTFAALNAVLLVVGSALWGTEIWVTGAVILMVIFPLMGLRRWLDRCHARSEGHDVRSLGRTSRVTDPP